jgi:hypothetical protein
VRFDVVGRMPASLLSTENLQILDLGVSGALVEAALPLPPNAEYRVQLVLESHVSAVTVKVRRVVAAGPETGSACYQIGLEFLSISPEAEDVITGMLTAADGEVPASAPPAEAEGLTT